MTLDDYFNQKPSDEEIFLCIEGFGKKVHEDVSKNILGKSLKEMLIVFLANGHKNSSGYFRTVYPAILGKISVGIKQKLLENSLVGQDCEYEKIFSAIMGYVHFRFCALNQSKDNDKGENALKLLSLVKNDFLTKEVQEQVDDILNKVLVTVLGKEKKKPHISQVYRYASQDFKNFVEHYRYQKCVNFMNTALIGVKQATDWVSVEKALKSKMMDLPFQIKRKDVFLPESLMSEEVFNNFLEMFETVNYASRKHSYEKKLLTTNLNIIWQIYCTEGYVPKDFVVEKLHLYLEKHDFFTAARYFIGLNKEDEDYSKLEKGFIDSVIKNQPYTIKYLKNGDCYCVTIDEVHLDLLQEFKAKKGDFVAKHRNEFYHSIGGDSTVFFDLLKLVGETPKNLNIVVEDNCYLFIGNKELTEQENLEVLQAQMKHLIDKYLVPLKGMFPLAFFDVSDNYVKEIENYRNIKIDELLMKKDISNTVIGNNIKIRKF